MPKPEPVRSLTAADVDRKFSDALPGVATIIHEVRPLSSNLFAPTFTLIELAFAESLHDSHGDTYAAQIRTRMQVF